MRKEVREASEPRFDSDDKVECRSASTLASFQGQLEVRTKVISRPFTLHAIPSIKNTLNLQDIMTSPFTTTLPLVDLLKVKLELWEQVARRLNRQKYVDLTHILQMEQLNKQPSQKKLVSVNGMSHTKSTRTNMGNTKLLAECKGVRTLAILDTSAGISIATKTMWGKKKMKD